MLSCILLTLEGTCIEDLKVEFTKEKQLVVEFDNDCYKSNNFTTLEANIKFDKYNTVFNTRTNSSADDVEFRFDCGRAQPNSDCYELFNDLADGKEPKGDAQFHFSGKNSLDEHYSFSVDNKLNDELSDEDITWIVVGSILGVAAVVVIVLVFLCCCGCISCCCKCCKPKDKSEKQRLIVVDTDQMAQPAPVMPPQFTQAQPMPYPQQPPMSQPYQIPPAQQMPQMAPVFPQNL